SERLIAAIESFGGAGTTAGGSAAKAPVQPVDNAAGGETGEWSIRFRPNPGLLASGGNPVALLRELRELGACEVVAHTDAVPALDDLQPDVCYLRWSITLHSACDENAIRDVFIFVEDNGNLEIERVPVPAAQRPAERPASANPAAQPAPSREPNRSP